MKCVFKQQDLTNLTNMSNFHPPEVGSRGSETQQCAVRSVVLCTIRNL